MKKIAINLKRIDWGVAAFDADGNVDVYLSQTHILKFKNLEDEHGPISLRTFAVPHNIQQDVEVYANEEFTFRNFSQERLKDALKEAEVNLYFKVAEIQAIEKALATNHIMAKEVVLVNSDGQELEGYNIEDDDLRMKYYNSLKAYNVYVTFSDEVDVTEYENNARIEGMRQAAETVSNINKGKHIDNGVDRNIFVEAIDSVIEVTKKIKVGLLQMFIGVFLNELGNVLLTKFPHPAVQVGAIFIKLIGRLIKLNGFAQAINNLGFKKGWEA